MLSQHRGIRPNIRLPKNASKEEYETTISSRGILIEKVHDRTRETDTEQRSRRPARHSCGELVELSPADIGGLPPHQQEQGRTGIELRGVVAGESAPGAGDGQCPGDGRESMDSVVSTFSSGTKMSPSATRVVWLPTTAPSSSGPALCRFSSTGARAVTTVSGVLLHRRDGQRRIEAPAAGACGTGAGPARARNRWRAGLAAVPKLGQAGLAGCGAEFLAYFW